MNPVLNTSILDLTPAKVGVLVALGALLLSGLWVRVPRSDWLALGLVGAYVGWLVLTAVLRGSAADLKMTIGYALYFGAPVLAGYFAGLRMPAELSRLLILAVVVVLGATFAIVVLERVTYPGLGQPDPLAVMWAFFRPQTPMDDPVRGMLTPPPLHFPSGDPAIPRASGWFAHANYLAFFGVLAAALTATMLVRAVGSRRRGAAFAAGLGLAASCVIVVWTYSRVGLVGLVGVGGAALVIALLASLGRSASTRRRLIGFAPALVILLTVGLTLGVDSIGLRRFEGTVVPPPAGAPSPGVTSPEEDLAAIEASATRASALRFAMQQAALDLIFESPRALLLGPGQAAYEAAIHDESGPLYIKEASAFRDSNSLWLTLSAAGGVPAAVILVVVLLIVSLRLVRSVLLGRDDGPSVVVAWLATWLPVWGLMQIFGTFPFATSEAIILGTMLGSAIALTSRGSEEAVPTPGVSLASASGD